MKLRKGFTIVELLMVISIIAVLMTLITTASTSAIRRAREHKADAIVMVVQQGINTYYAQKGKWPGDNWYHKADTQNDVEDTETYTLTKDDVDECIREVVRESVIKKNPLLDVTGLYVCEEKYADGARAAGMDFMDALHGTKQHPSKILSLSNMVFGYPEESHGYFHRLSISYSIASDRITVSK